MILPVNLNPYAKTYQYHALPLSALTAEDFDHDILVHGYEDGNLRVLGYCDDGAYRSTRVSLDDFSKAVIDDARATFFKANRAYKHILDKKLISDLIAGYLASEGELIGECQPDEIS